MVSGVGSSHDVTAAIGACRSLGATIEQVGDDLHISGTNNIQAARIDVGESGLLTRLIAPVATVAGDAFEIRGSGTLNSRPMNALIDALIQFGVRVTSHEDHQCLPLKIEGAARPLPQFYLNGKDGSQVLSGLLMSLPLFEGDRIICVENLQSKPYIDLTINILSHFGIEIQNSDYSRFIINGAQHYRPANYRVEGDWSGASYFLVADAIVGGGAIAVTGLDDNSTQADRAILAALKLADGSAAFEFDATHCPDLFPSLVVLAAHCRGESRIIGTSRLAHKESARDLILQKEWAKFGIQIDMSAPNTMAIKGLGGSPATQSEPIDPHGDHRIAMAAAMMGRGVMIDHKEVVAKSFPEFWEEHHKIEHLLNRISK